MTCLNHNFSKHGSKQLKYLKSGNYITFFSCNWTWTTIVLEQFRHQNIDGNIFYSKPTYIELSQVTQKDDFYPLFNHDSFYLESTLPRDDRHGSDWCQLSLVRIHLQLSLRYVALVHSHLRFQNHCSLLRKIHCFMIFVFVKLQGMVLDSFCSFGLGSTHAWTGFVPIYCILTQIDLVLCMVYRVALEDMNGILKSRLRHYQSYQP